MPLLADKRITVRNLRYDPDTDTETEICTVLDGVSVHAKTVAAAADDGLHACCVAQIRIFSADTLSAPQSTPDAPLPAGDTYWSLPRGRALTPLQPPRRGRCVPATASSTRVRR